MGDISLGAFRCGPREVGKVTAGENGPRAPVLRKTRVEADAPESEYFLRVLFLSWARRSWGRQDPVLV